MSEFWKQHFDKFLLTLLFLVTLGAFLHFARSSEFYATAANTQHLTGIVNWLENLDGQILAALLTLLVGAARAAAAAPQPPPGPPPAAPNPAPK